MQKLLGILILGLLLSGCGTTQRSVGADEHYTLCANQTTDIREIAQCGKDSRNAYLNRTGRRASNFGNKYVLFMDTLAEAVNEGSLTNSQAKLEWMKVNQQAQSQQTIIYGGQRTHPKAVCDASGGLLC